MTAGPATAAATARERESVFVSVVRAAAEHDALNLAQGVFDHGPLPAVLESLRAVGNGTEHQYAPSAGHPLLRAAVAGSVAAFEDVRVDPDTDVTVTAGATEAIYCALTALLDEGGEVVLFEPAYEQYRPVVEAAGGVVRAVTLPSPEARIDAAGLAAVCGPRTKAIVVNSPWNPWGRVLDEQERAAVAAVSAEFGIVVVADETYEHLMLDGSTHRGVLRAIPDPELRVKISSASKTLAVTGWRVGWAVAGPGLTRRIRARHQFVTFCPAVPLQIAVANVLRYEGFPALRREIVDGVRDRVHRFTASLNELGLKASVPQAGFYITADVGGDAHRWCLDMMPGRGVAALPMAVFFARSDPRTDRLVRFAVCKSGATLDDAVQRLRARIA